MMTFRVHFHRYRNGESRISAPHWVKAESFHDAASKAGLMVSAMSDADLSSRFIIASIAEDGLRGEECQTGWETAEEFSARVAPKQELAK